MSRTLIACVGNIFLSDDGFGVEVARRMSHVPLPSGVELVDFGIRGVHLAYQLLDGYDLLVVVDAAPHGQPPGTVSLLEVDPASVGDVRSPVAAGEAPLVDSHGLEPAAILSMLTSLGGAVQKVLVVACEPVTVEEGLGLSEPVEAAVPHAIELIERVMRSGLMPAEEVRT